jgi:phospholipase C
MATETTDLSRRQFFLEAARLSAGTGLAAALLASVERAFAIDPPPGTTYLDAEHVVILMQENRSFDHTFGTLRGVRGFNDPRAVTLPDQNPVWLQTNAAGETYAPFRLNIRETNATWLGSLPHSWRDQTDARHHGNHDRWLDAKPSSRRELRGMPLTLGYYDRTDLPFYYALADAFTVCDQNFCSSLTGTTPNRLYLWTGTIREKQNASSPANVRNSDVDYPSLVRWPTFPERLEDAGISWKIYQNELSVPSGFSSEEDAWLANFSDNPIEWFEQFHVFHSQSFRTFAAKAAVELPDEIAELKRKIASASHADAARLTRELDRKETLLGIIQRAGRFTEDAFARLTHREKRLHENAFITNSRDAAYRELTTLHYHDGTVERQMQVPKSDVLHQFREDVGQGKLPAVSWLVPPENFSDHPGAPWYGSWMVSEVLNILTQNPEVWKKTIFILTYDENDGYFDHVPPFAAPDPGDPESGKTSDGVDAGIEYWSLERDLERRSKAEARGSSIGLGFRVPMVIASPWSRGGYVCSQVFDHTSVLQLLEKVLGHRLGKEIRETNISAWRRTVCGDLSSTFQPAADASVQKLQHPERDAVLKAIHQAQFQPRPAGYRKLSASDVEAFRSNRDGVSWMPRQEEGVRPSRPLPYQLYASGKLSPGGKSLEIAMEARNDFFGAKSAGSPFHVYAPHNFGADVRRRTRAYAVEAGKRVNDVWTLDGFPDGLYRLCICGPNGFLRELGGSAQDPLIDVHCEYERRLPAAPSGDLTVVVTNRNQEQSCDIRLVDHTSNRGSQSATVKAGGAKTIHLRLSKTHCWYDFTLQVMGSPPYLRHCAGRVETGKPGYSDPALSRPV